MKKAVIHGASLEGKRFAMRAKYIFDIRAFIDRNTANTLSDFDGIPIFANYNDVVEKDIDYIFVMAQDYDGVLREYLPPPPPHFFPKLCPCYMVINWKSRNNFVRWLTRYTAIVFPALSLS